MTASDGAVLGVTRIVDHGPAEECWNLVILSEGYQASQLGQFATDAQMFADTLLSTSPFDGYQRVINVFRVDVSSTDSGADDPTSCGGTGATARTYFDATFCGAGIPRLLVVNETTALTVAAAQVPQFHMAVVIVNVTKYGGSGGSVAVFSLDPQAPEIALHEMGHTGFGLADEYPYLLGCGLETDHDVHPAMEPVQPNVTIDPGRATNKWRDLIVATTAMPTTRNADCTKCDPQGSPVAVGTIGAFEGADHYHCAAFRPAFVCRMNKLGNPFCQVCQRVIAARLSSFLPPTVNVAVLAVDPRVREGYLDALAVFDFVTAISAVTGTLRPLGSIRFPSDSADPSIPAEVTDARTRLLTQFPAPAVGIVTYFSLAGDPTAGTIAVRDARRKLVSHATTTATSFGAGSMTDQSVEVGQVAFDIARSHGITQPAIMVVDLVFSPVAVAVLAVANAQLLTRYNDQLAQGDLAGAIRTVCEDVHQLAVLSFQGESAVTIPDSAIGELKAAYRALFPGFQIVTDVQHFSRIGDLAAGSAGTRDQRVAAICVATSSGGGSGSAPGTGVFEVAAPVFDIARAAGVPEVNVIAVVIPAIAEPV